ncbi:MAG TPA: helix-turn-helix domain-containing GNAT family N-acetyltransferase [Steroidobacteraceae bacterium]|nr:helix-turn-helix domain-containing GNAT family N-acetyltransferase [Steroidobacteraceae bacterium]
MHVSSEQVEQVRAFNRDYTRRIGVLSQGLLGSTWSLTQMRVMYEIAHRPGITAGELAADLGLDRGYLSRTLKGFEARRLLGRAASEEDARRQHLRLTAAGQRVFAPLERRARQEVRGLLSAVDPARRPALLHAMSTIRDCFAPVAGSGVITLRAHRPGDMGWVVERHGKLYFEEYGWNMEFEALVAGITAEFIRKFDPLRERCWIAERQGHRLGCIFLVAEDAATAKLRLLLVEPDARGLGLGRRLVSECVNFARTAGYERVVLWTQSNLTAARRLYELAGFRCIGREPHRSFGQALTAETWERGLGR